MSVTLRVRALVSDNFALVLATLVGLALVAGVVTYATHVDPGTTVETRQVASWESTGEFAHRATVVNGTAAFDEGAVLRNRSVYFDRVTPTLDGSFTYSYAASDGGNLTATVSTALVIRSVSESESGEVTEYWRVERPLDTERVGPLSPGESADVPFSANVTEAFQQAERIDRRHGDTPGQTRVSVVARVDQAGTRNGEQVDRTRRYALPITSRGGVYSVEDPGPTTESGGTNAEVTVPASYGPVRTLGGPALLLLSLGLTAAVVVARRRDRLSVSDRERAVLAHERARDEFDDWITVGSVPAAARRRPAVEVDSLEGLVDVAIDVDERVIEDRERDEYVVVAEPVCYVFRPPGRPEREPSADGLNGTSTGDGATDGDATAIEAIRTRSNGTEPTGDAEPSPGDENGAYGPE